MTTMTTMTSTEFRRLRKSLGITQAALAERLGVTARTIRYWEFGRLPPARAAAIALAYMAGETPSSASP